MCNWVTTVSNMSFVHFHRTENNNHRLVNPQSETTWIYKIFGGYLQSQVTCRKCNHARNKFESILDISLSIVRQGSIEAALATFAEVDYLGDQDRYKCDR
jgi:ubiquitin C-terminal hydrolase